MAKKTADGYMMKLVACTTPEEMAQVRAEAIAAYLDPVKRAIQDAPVVDRGFVIQALKSILDEQVAASANPLM